MVAARRALDDLYRSHAAEVYRYAYAVLGNHADAEDVTQTTFVNALRALERGERPRKPSNWLITITHNIVRQRFRQQQARPTEVELIREVAQEPEESNGPSMEELVRALQRIPQSQREALVLRELEGRSYDEIARDPQPHQERARDPPLPRPPLPRGRARERGDLRSRRAQSLPAARRPDLPQGAQAAPRSHRRMPGLRAPPGDPGQAAARVQGSCPPPPPLRAHVLQGRAERFGGNGAAHDRCGRGPRLSSAAGRATGGGVSLGGFAIGGVALKAAAVVAAASVAGGVGIVGAREVDHNRTPAKSQPASAARALRDEPRSDRRVTDAGADEARGSRSTSRSRPVPRANGARTDRSTTHAQKQTGRARVPRLPAT